MTIDEAHKKLCRKLNLPEDTSLSDLLSVVIPIIQKKSLEISTRGTPLSVQKEIHKRRCSIIENLINRLGKKKKMRDFTQEEKELIINTPITIDSFDISKGDISCTTLNYIGQLEQRRKDLLTGYQPRGIDVEFKVLVSLLPSSYKAVKL